MQAAEALALADELTLLSDAARAGGNLAMEFWRREPETWLKDGGSPVSEADLAVDRLLRDRLISARPNCGWLSEEADEADQDVASEDNQRMFVVDPIDGTRSFLAGQRIWGVSIALVQNCRPIAAALFCPAMELDYAAVLDGGATCNGNELTTNGEAERPVMAGPRSWLKRMPAGYAERVEKAPYIPSLAYRIAMVAEGSLDGTYIRASAKDWDLAAADLILREAGGSLLRSDGEPPLYGTQSRRHGLLVAGSAAQLPHMLRMVRQTPEQD